MFYTISGQFHPQDDLTSRIEQIFDYQVGLS